MKKMLAVLMVAVIGQMVWAEDLSIREIQYTTDPAGASPYDFQVVDCAGGIVTHKYGFSRVKITVQDPCDPNGWGAIHAKDLDQIGIFDSVNIGDRIRLINFEVEEFRGTTFLQCITANNPNIEILSTGNELPLPLSVSPNDLPAPVYDPIEDGWFVEDHNAEKYEAMLLKVQNVKVTQMGLRKDNYVLSEIADEQVGCWASDYGNMDATGDTHEYIQMDQEYCDITGVVEQYTDLVSGWDYYQLLTRKTEDIRPTLPADVTGDCAVDFADLALMAQYWLRGK